MKIEKQIFNINKSLYLMNKVNIPLDVLNIIASYLVKPKMKLLDWIPLDNLDWDTLSENPNAIHLLEQNMDKINWTNLSLNPNAIHLLEQNIDEIDWNMLSRNPNAIHLLEQNIDKINWRNLSHNPSIFEIDNKQLKIDIDDQAHIIDKIIHQ
jgi:hypothetical protein